MIRTDIHRPSAIQPENYTYIDSMDTEWGLGPADKGPGGLYETIERAENSTADHSDSINRCDHCGAHLRYICFWEHIPSGEVITTGETCAHETMDVPNRLILDQKRLRETAAARRAAIREREEVRVRREETAKLYPQAAEILDDYQGENYFIQDVARRYGKNGYLSKAQADRVVEVFEKDQQPKVEEVKNPVPTGKVRVEGEVVSIKLQENDFGSRLVMVVKGDGWAVWGTVPSKIDDVVRGDKVAFNATVTASDRDESFGFYKRPTKPEITERG